MLTGRMHQHNTHATRPKVKGMLLLLLQNGARLLLVKMFHKGVQMQACVECSTALVGVVGPNHVRRSQPHPRQTDSNNVVEFPRPST